MAQLDYFLRDWRANAFVSISGKTIDLLWELHQELGSKQPINVICGFRSAQTNALLNRIGRHVAARSEHLLAALSTWSFQMCRSSCCATELCCTRRAASGIILPGKVGLFISIRVG
jgi:hypothetical protein